MTYRLYGEKEKDMYTNQEINQMDYKEFSKLNRETRIEILLNGYSEEEIKGSDTDRDLENLFCKMREI